ncbi:PGF-CTERM sorting domain-containing protein [Halorussus gelatinilyticus]|uniref:PGF-CTERM sorting domain-containing protein n=1 Tax=Halorussus gelatinilyticus TaxID=2937524 RepID=A0A8U0IL21_9EURY|nr:BGTF surface domain-containing protein [Halorussus gelatinilyticus]UPW01321.1 PGF-CTERM sorting domain-containing protein [Halorussus gelatinilyticus]
MFDTALHRQVVLAALVALAGVAGAAAGASAAADDVSAHSVQQLDSSVAQTDETNQSENVTASFVHDGEKLDISPISEQNVTTRTNAAAGTTLNLVLRKNGSFVDQREATVSKNGTATVSIYSQNLRLRPHSEISLVVRYDGRTLAETTGVVKETSVEFVHDGERLVLENTANQTVKLRTDAEPGEKVVVKIEGESFGIMTPEVVAADGTANATFDLSDVPSGTEVNLTLQSSSKVTEGVILNESAMATETTTDAPTETTTDDTATTTDEIETTTQGDNESGIPGFGVPVALLALVAGVAHARRA